jgi:hypothetical protein
MSFTLDGDQSTSDTDYFVGTESADTFNPTDGTPDIGNGKDIIDGLGGDDVINAGNGTDTLIGGSGDDTLTGGNGGDTFSYNFTMTASTSSSAPQSYAAYLAELGLTLDSQNVFSTTYSAWLNYLVFGGDDGWGGLAEKFSWQGEVTIGLNQNGTGEDHPHISVDGVAMDLDDIFGNAESLSWTKGKATQTRTFWDLDEDYDWGGETTVSSADGNDTVVDFKVDADPSKSDMLFFTIDVTVDLTTLTDEKKAVLIDEFKDKFTVTTGSFGGDSATDTKMVLDDGDEVTTNDMSITLLGYDGGDSIWGYVEFSFA